MQLPPSELGTAVRRSSKMMKDSSKAEPLDYLSAILANLGWTKDDYLPVADILAHEIAQKNMKKTLEALRDFGGYRAEFGVASILRALSPEDFPPNEPILINIGKFGKLFQYLSGFREDKNTEPEEWTCYTPVFDLAIADGAQADVSWYTNQASQYSLMVSISGAKGGKGKIKKYNLKIRYNNITGSKQLFLEYKLRSRRFENSLGDKLWIADVIWVADTIGLCTEGHEEYQPFIGNRKNVRRGSIGVDLELTETVEVASKSMFQLDVHRMLRNPKTYTPISTSFTIQSESVSGGGLSFECRTNQVEGLNLYRSDKASLVYTVQ